MIRNFVLLLFLFFSFNQLALSQRYQYVDNSDLGLLINDGWELLYTQEGVKIVNFTKMMRGLAFSEKLDQDNYRIVLMDSLNRMLDEEMINVNKGFMHQPLFYSDYYRTYYGPLFKKYYVLDWEKEKIKSFSNEFLRSKDLYQKQFLQKEDYAFKNFIRMDKSYKYFTLVSENGARKDTLFDIADPDKMLYMGLEGRTLSVEFINDHAYVLNNHTNQLYKYELQSNTMVDSVDLPYPNKGRNFPYFRIEKDVAKNVLYLVSSIEKDGKFWRIVTDQTRLTFESKQIHQLSSMYHAKFYDGFMYNLFYLEDLNASGIYKKPLY